MGKGVKSIDGECVLTYIGFDLVINRINMFSINRVFAPSTALVHLPGIGKRTPRALARYGMKTVGQFATLTESEASALLGGSGVRLLKSARALLSSDYAMR